MADATDGWGWSEAPSLNNGAEVEVLHKFKRLPQDRKDILKLALQYACAYCEKEFQVSTTGKSHGICKRHAAEMWAKLGKPAPEFKGKCVDLATLSPDERKLLVDLFAVVNKPKKSNGIREGRCEDYPCCGHEQGGCPNVDPETGEETYGCASCGKPLPPLSRSSLCSVCLGRMHRQMDQGYDDFEGETGEY